jgi:hypothetical protein
VRGLSCQETRRTDMDFRLCEWEMIQRNEDNGRIALMLNDDKIVCCRKNIKSNEARRKNIANERTE